MLIAEDHDDSREALRALLEAFGYQVRVATNGREAVEAARAGAPDLILMDVMMPELDGLAATRLLRSEERFGETPIIALTAMEGANELSRAAGCSDYMAKPIDVRAFVAKLHFWLDPEPGTEAAA